MIAYKDVASVVAFEEEYEFLGDLIPVKATKAQRPRRSGAAAVASGSADAVAPAAQASGAGSDAAAAAATSVTSGPMDALLKKGASAEEEAPEVVDTQNAEQQNEKGIAHTSWGFAILFKYFPFFFFAIYSLMLNLFT